MMRSTILAAALLFAGLAAAHAQAVLPGDGNDELVKPPELRAAPEGSTAPAPPTSRRRAKAAPREATRRPAPASPIVSERQTVVEHPIDFGIQAHGGGEAQHFSVTSGSPPGEETGNGVAAGVRVGF